MREKEHVVLRRFGVAGLAMGAVVLMAAPAWAHVGITPTSAPKGSDAVLAFTVPDESDTASTVTVAVFFPTDHPIADALVEPIAGWTAKVEMMHVAKAIKTDSGSVNDAVKSVTWTGGHIVPGDFQQFKVSVGLPSDASSLEFKALQTYSDGTLVSWIEDTPAGGPEPDHPAPVLTLTAAEDATGGTTPTSAGGTGASTPATLPTNVATTSDVNSAKTLSYVAIGVGAVGLILALGAFALGRGPRKPAAR
jgi:uncharacterized protein YcnI